MELSMMSSFSGSKGPFSVFTILPVQLNRSETFFTCVITSTLSRIIKAPSGLSIRSISSSISSTSHLQIPVRKIMKNYLLWQVVTNDFLYVYHSSSRPTVMPLRNSTKFEGSSQISNEFIYFFFKLPPPPLSMFRSKRDKKHITVIVIVVW